jgi:hypothetical protein
MTFPSRTSTLSLATSEQSAGQGKDEWTLMMSPRGPWTVRAGIF